MLPEVDNEDFRGRKREQGSFAFEVLVHMVNKKRNNAMVVIYTWSSSRSRPSVPSTSMTMTFISLSRHTQIPMHYLYSISQTKFARSSPLVVCCLLVSSMTSKFVPNSLFNGVSVQHLGQPPSHRKALFVEHPLFPVDCDPNTETMLYSNPESSRLI